MVFEVFRSGPPLLVSLARHLGLFDLWFLALLSLGLVTMEKMKTRGAILSACMAYALILSLLVGVDLLTGGGGHG
jgi:hypothetical protein